MELDNTCSIKEAVKEAKISRKYLTRLMNLGEVSAFKLNKRVVRVDLGSLRRWIKSTKMTTTYHKVSNVADVANVAGVGERSRQAEPEDALF